MNLNIEPQHTGTKDYIMHRYIYIKLKNKGIYKYLSSETLQKGKELTIINIRTLVI